MNDKKITFYIILILLIIFVPLAGIGTTLHFKNKPTKKENTNQEFLYDGKLHFYKDGVLVGTYTCENQDEYCDYAVFKNKKEYSLVEYEPESVSKSTFIDDTYAFLMDTTTSNLQNAEILLVDVTNNRVMGRYKEVKNYGIGIENQNYIIKNNEDKWGIVQFYDGLILKVPFTYDYIGLANRIDIASNKIISDAFAVLKDGKWQLIDINGKELTSPFNQTIVTYSNEYIVLEENGNMQLVDYKGGNRLSETYKYLNFYNKYLGIINNNSEFYLYDLATDQIASNQHKVDTVSDVEVEIAENTLQIKIGGTLVESVAIS